MYVAGLVLGTMELLPVNRRKNILWGLCEALAFANSQWLEEHPSTPPLYQLAPRYLLKVRTFSIDEWSDIPVVVERRTGDCKDFCAWRASELRRKGVPLVNFDILYKPMRGPKGEVIELWHVRLLIGSEIEDPSKLLGMPSQVPFQALRGVFQ